jgi:hypothetical protein
MGTTEKAGSGFRAHLELVGARGPDAPAPKEILSPRISPARAPQRARCRLRIDGPRGESGIEMLLLFAFRLQTIN